jgi:hypothetical protein
MKTQLPPKPVQAAPRHHEKMQPFKCDCGIVLGWTDGVILALDRVSFNKRVTGRCAGCGKLKTWSPKRPI